MTDNCLLKLVCCSKSNNVLLIDESVFKPEADSSSQLLLFFCVYWKERAYLKLKVYNNLHIHSLNAGLLEFYCLCSRQKYECAQGFVGLTEPTLLDKWRKFHAHHEWETSGQYVPQTSCCLHGGSLVQSHKSQLPKACGIHQVAGWRQDKTLLCSERAAWGLHMLS